MRVQRVRVTRINRVLMRDPKGLVGSQGSGSEPGAKGLIQQKYFSSKSKG
jgi:hypothetical protein